MKAKEVTNFVKRAEGNFNASFLQIKFLLLKNSSCSSFFRNSGILFEILEHLLYLCIWSGNLFST